MILQYNIQGGNTKQTSTHTDEVSLYTCRFRRFLSEDPNL